MMFKINDGRINIFGRNVEIYEGTHEVSINTEDGAIYTDSSAGDPVVGYTLESDGHIVISSRLVNPEKIGKQPVKALDMFGESIVSKGPFYDSLDVATVYLEGFLMSFNYYAMANIVSAITPYIWAGGRVCNSSFFTPGAINPAYTAMPSSGRCGSAGAGGFDYFSSPVHDSMRDFVGNATSIVFSYRTHRKYIFFASNVDGLFGSPLGSIGGSADSSPPNGSVPDPKDVSFRFSMHSLRQ